MINEGKNYDNSSTTLFLCARWYRKGFNATYHWGLFVKDKTSDSREGEKVKLKSSIIKVIKNKMFIRLLAVLLLANAALDIFNANSVYYFTYVTRHFNHYYLFVYMIILQMIGSVAYHFLRNFLSANQVMLTSLFLNIAGFSLLLLFGYFLPAWQLGVIIGGAIQQFGRGLFYTAAVIAIADCVDYGKKYLHHDSSALLNSSVNLSKKVMVGVMSFLVTHGLTFFGYLPNAVQNGGTVAFIRSVTLILPICLIILAALIYWFSYLPYSKNESN